MKNFRPNSGKKLVPSGKYYSDLCGEENITKKDDCLLVCGKINCTEIKRKVLSSKLIDRKPYC